MCKNLGPESSYIGLKFRESCHAEWFWNLAARPTEDGGNEPLLPKRNVSTKVSERQVMTLEYRFLPMLLDFDLLDARFLQYDLADHGSFL